MWNLGTILRSVVLNLLGQPTPLDRWAALRKAPSWSHGWEWAILALIVVLGTALIGAMVALRQRRRVFPTATVKDSYGGDKVLTISEIELLARLIQQSGLTKVDPKSTLEHAFNVGASNYLGSETFLEMTEENRHGASDMIDRLRAKLGVETPKPEENALSTRKIPVGAKIIAVQIGQQDDVPMTVQRNTLDGLLVEPPGSLNVRLGQGWVMRYFNGTQVWEFTSHILHQIEKCLLLKHTDQMRTVNLRRFIRVPTDRRALVSRFPFRGSQTKMIPPIFLPAQVVEIAGPGLMILINQEARPGDRILVVMELDEGRTIQAVGKIRRKALTSASAFLEGSSSAYGMELVDLTPAQIAELMSATNAAAIEQKRNMNATHKVSAVAV